MDRTQLVGGKPAVSKAILVTLNALIASDVGFLAGIFAGATGDLTLDVAAGVGFGAAAGAFGIGMRVVTFIRSTSHH
ncbi:hypothetical protein ACH4LS_37170 [Streptomyces luteogriseus]|uniref:hypothetical protein n=1 Tax=Streptomyces luteogriseus TaxID=68233 RepID=UPI0037ACBEA6